MEPLKNYPEEFWEAMNPPEADSALPFTILIIVILTIYLLGLLVPRP